MKLDKVYVYGEKAQRVVSKRLGFSPPPLMNLRILYLLKRQPMNLTQTTKALRHSGYGGDVTNVFPLIKLLVTEGLVDKDGTLYSLSPLGRQYLSGIRNYLFNIRM